MGRRHNRLPYVLAAPELRHCRLLMLIHSGYFLSPYLMDGKVRSLLHFQHGTIMLKLLIEHPNHEFI